MSEKIEQLAEQAGFEVHHAGIATVNFWIDTKIKKFAELIRADEREACIKACDRVDLIGADECIEAIRARSKE